MDQSICKYYYKKIDKYRANREISMIERLSKEN